MDELPFLKAILYSGQSGRNGGFLPIGALRNMVSTKELYMSESAVHPADTAYIIYTSGTTSQPKAVMTSHNSWVNMAISQADDLKVTEVDRLCTVLPLFHCFSIGVNMMVAWYFATALAKRYEEILPYFTERRLALWTHNKAIQKAIESRRISPEQKEELRAVKIRGEGA